VNNANAFSSQGTFAKRTGGLALAGSVLMLGLMMTAAGVAEAQNAAGPVPQPADGSLTLHGVTLFGIVDLGVQYDSHAAPFSDYFMAGSADIVQKNSRSSQQGITSNNLSQSRVGLQGIEPLGVGDVYGIFKLETFFNPSSGNLSDALRSLTQNNGRPLDTQTTNLDSSIAGQIFQQSFIGFSSATFGSLTFGRQNTVLADGVAKYDPNAASQAFSIVGLSGTSAGGGDTQDRRLDNSVKYVGNFGPFHAGAQYKFNNSRGAANTAFEAAIGAEYLGASIDAYYANVTDAVAAAALSAAQLADLQGLGFFSPDKSVAATISDNETWAIMAMYSANLPKVGAIKFYGAFERINFTDPKNPLEAGFDDIGGYKLAFVNNTAFPKPKVLYVDWVGVKYTVLSKLDLTVAWYGYQQKSYAVGTNAGCSSTVAGSCSGDESVYSFDADYRFSKRFDVYVGAMYSSVSDGLASGYLFNTTNINPTAGFRFRF